MIRDGTFGWADIFESLVESITRGGDYYLLANDFPAYVDCQVGVCKPVSLLHLLRLMPLADSQAGGLVSTYMRADKRWKQCKQVMIAPALS